MGRLCEAESCTGAGVPGSKLIRRGGGGLMLRVWEGERYTSRARVGLTSLSPILFHNIINRI